MKVLVLSGRFGMGHEMAANAICEQFRKIDEQAEIEKKDLLIISSGSGETDSLIVMANKAKEAGASVVTVTIHPEASIGKVCESCIVIPGATPKSNLEDTVKSVQPMGNAFEQMTWLVYDAVIMILMKKLGKTEEEMFKHHANLE